MKQGRPVEFFVKEGLRVSIWSKLEGFEDLLVEFLLLESFHFVQLLVLVSLHLVHLGEDPVHVIIHLVHLLLEAVDLEVDVLHAFSDLVRDLLGDGFDVRTG